MQLVIDRFGRMLLPKAMREVLGVQAGDMLDAEATSEALVLRPAGRTDRLRSKGRVLVFDGAAEGDLADAARKLRDERLERVGALKARP